MINPNKTPRSQHNLGHYKLLSMNMGKLVPNMVLPVLRGDTIKVKTGGFFRIKPQAKPIMHPVHIKQHYFYFPYRILWSGWNDFITGGPDNTSAPTVPYCSVGSPGVTAGSLDNFLGQPVGCTNTFEAFCRRAYAFAFNENYRDQQLQTPLAMATTSGEDTTTNSTLQDICWNKDRYTMSRPEPQLGPAITLPLGQSAPVVRTSGTSNAVIAMASGGGLAPAGTVNINTGDAALFSSGGGTPSINLDPNGTLEADLENATAVDVMDVRLAMALQVMAEWKNKFGNRYPEFLESYGILPSDASLQIPQFLGGSSQTLNFGSIIQTAPTTSGDESGVGDLYGIGTGGIKNAGFARFFEEDGIILGFSSIMPQSMYMQGQPATTTRTTREQFYLKELAHIGQQAVLNKEVKHDHAQPNGVWGWMDRYDEYRNIENTVAGSMATSQNWDWHYARYFSTDPGLNADFVKGNPTNRVYMSSDGDDVDMIFKHSVKATRNIPKRGTAFIF